jgi:flagellar biosynthesis protein FlgN
MQRTIAQNLLLEAESQAVVVLLDLLEQEQQALIRADIKLIADLVASKSQALSSIHQHAQTRYKTLKQLGFKDDELGMEDWLKNQHKSVQSFWLSAQQTLLKAKELNRVNGILIQKHMQRTQQMLNVIQQKSGTEQVYGPNGQTTSQMRLRNAIIS